MFITDIQTVSSAQIRTNKTEFWIYGQVRTLNLQSLTFKSLWEENWRTQRSLTCVYLLTVVDQKNLHMGGWGRRIKPQVCLCLSDLRYSPWWKLNLSFMLSEIENTTKTVRLLSIKISMTMCHIEHHMHHFTALTYMQNCFASIEL